MVNLLRNDRVSYNKYSGARRYVRGNRRFDHAELWAIRDWELVLSSRGEPLGYMCQGEFVPFTR